MTAPGVGQYGSTHYESPESQALGSITLESYSKVYDDQGKFLSKLASDTSYMAAMMRKMQGGIDKANENFIQQIQDMINDVLVLLGGGDSLSGLDFGDLKYVIQAIGALLGFGDGSGGIGLPINLYTAAWHFVSTYIFPVENFKEVINEIIDAAIAGILGLFGTTPVLGEALEQLAVIISNIRDSILPLTTALDALFTAFGGDATTGDLGDFSPLWTALMNLFGALTGPEVEALVPIFQVFATWTTPFIDLLTQIVNDLTPYVDDLASLFDALTPIITEITDLVTAFEPYLDELSSFLEALMPIFTAIAGLASMFGFGSTPGGFDPTSAVATFITSFLNPSGLLTAILDPTQLLNAQNLYNLIPPNLLGLIPFSSVGQSTQNLLTNPSFEGAASVQGSGVWFWDSTQGNTSLGSVYVDADGTTRQLISNAIPVGPGDKIATSIFSKWSSLTHTGNAFKVQVLEISNYVAVNTVDVILSGSLVTNQTTWTQFNGTPYTVPSSGVDQVALQLERESTVSTGRIRFDDASLTKTGLLNPSWMSGFLGGSTIQDDIQSILTEATSALGFGTGGLPASLSQFAAALQQIPFANVLGIQGIIDIGNAVQHTWNQLTQAFGGITSAVNEVHQLNIGGSPSGGTFQLISPLDFTQLTSALPINATASAIQTALTSLSSIGSGNVAVSGGPLMTAPVNITYQNSLANTPINVLGHVDSLVGGTNPAVAINEIARGGDTTTLAQLFSLAQTQTLNASTALSLVTTATNILGIRNNNPIFGAIDRLAEGSHPLNGGRSMVVATSSSAPMSFQTVAHDVTKTYLNLQAYKTGTVTNLYINVYKLDGSNNLQSVFKSPDISSQLGTTSPGAWLTVDMSGSPLSTLAGEAYGMEAVVVGSGSVTLLGSTVSDVAAHPTAVPKHPAGSRNPATLGNQPTTISAASVSYGGVNQPFFSFGTGSPPPAYIPPQTTEFNTHGSGSYTIPTFARVAGAKVDVIVLGGGGAGQGEQGYNLGQGGYAGLWNAVTLTCGVDYPVGATSLSYVVGAGGAQQITYFANGNNGSASSVTWNDGTTNHTITGAGGTGGHGGGFGYDGQGAGNETWNSITYPGGVEVGSGSTGSAPGGGGGGAPPYLFGGAGADGAVWFVARQL